jgi:hypothetical protein
MPSPPYTIYLLMEGIISGTEMGRWRREDPLIAHHVSYKHKMLLRILTRIFSKLSKLQHRYVYTHQTPDLRYSRLKREETSGAPDEEQLT